MVLKKSLTLFDRDEEGKLISKEVELYIDEKDEEQKKYRGETIFITPLVRGEIKRMFANIKDNKDEDIDEKIVVEHCINPKYTLEEIKHMKPSYSLMIVNTIMKESGLKVDKPKIDALKEKEDDFAKN